MITKGQISAVLDHPVYDSEGKKIGEAKHVYVDDATGEPEWVSVKTGMFGNTESFVPMRGAAMVRDHMQVTCAKDKVKDAPHVDVQANGHLSVAEEQRLYDHYGIAWDEAWHKANQPGEGGWARSDAAGSSPGSAGGTGVDAGTAGAAGVAGGISGNTASGTGTGMTAGTAGTDARDDVTDVPGAAGTASADASGRAMTRSEEEMHVAAERRPVGHARLRKYVVTEEQQQTIPVRHEEARVVREPITEANRGEALSGPEIAEDEYEVTLYAEEPVIETRVEPKERVRLTTVEHVEEETVTGQIRKERIETELPDEPDESGERGRGRL